MLFDPFEEQLHLPAAAIQLGDAQGWQGKLVGQEDEPLVRLRIAVLDTTQRYGKILVGIVASQDYGLIADKSSRAIHRMRVTTLGPERGLGACDEEAARFVQAVEPIEVEVAAVHHIVSAGLRHEQVQYVDFVILAVADMDKTGDIAAQIEQGMQFDGGLGRAKRRPWKHRQTQIDRCGIERVHRLGQIHPKGLVGIQATRHANQPLSKAGIDPPVARGIGVGKCVARNRATDPQMIELGGLRSQTRLNIAQALPVRQLRKGHAQVLIQTREALDLVLAVVKSHAPTKSAERKMAHQLRKHELALMHRATPRQLPRSRCARANRCSNRDQTESAFYVPCSIT